MNGVYLNRFLLCNLLILFAQQGLYAQKTSADSSFKPGGKLWGLAFGDYYYKAHSDPQNRGTAQYSNIEKGRNAFQFRRFYLGYNYDITKKFAAELVLAAEDNVVNASGTSLDFTPILNVHFQPNIWYNRYTPQQSAPGNERNHDLVYRVTFFYVYGR